jgi:putative ABC transport system permease protein
VALLTLRDVQHRAVRFGAVIVGTAVVFTLLFLMTGLVEQFHREPRDTVAAFGADGWVVREGSSGAFTSGATMPADTAALVRGAEATPVVVARHSIDDGGEPVDVVVVGIPPGGLGEPSLEAGRRADGPGQLVIDDSSGLAIGDRTTLGDQRYVVTGVTDRTTMFAGMPLVFLELDVAQDLVYRGQPLATTLLLRGDDPTVPEGFTVLRPDEVASDGMRPLERSISSVTLIRLLLWFVAAMIIGTMVYLSSLERRRDVAVLTAIGASRRQMGASIALQAALTGLVAALVAAVLQRVVVPVFPLEVTVPDRAFVPGAVGLRTALRTDPALAFAGPGG